MEKTSPKWTKLDIGWRNASSEALVALQALCEVVLSRSIGASDAWVPSLSAQQGLRDGSARLCIEAYCKAHNLTLETQKATDKNRQPMKMWQLRIRDASGNTLLYFATDSANRNASPRAKSVIAQQMVREAVIVPINIQLQRRLYFAALIELVNKGKIYLKEPPPVPHLLGVALRLHGQIARQNVERMAPAQRPTTDCTVVLSTLTDAQRRELLQLLKTLEREPVNDAPEAVPNGEASSSSRQLENRSEGSIVLLSSDDELTEVTPPKRARRTAPGDNATPLLSRPHLDSKHPSEDSERARRDFMPIAMQTSALAPQLSKLLPEHSVATPPSTSEETAAMHDAQDTPEQRAVRGEVRDRVRTIIAEYQLSHEQLKRTLAELNTELESMAQREDEVSLPSDTDSHVTSLSVEVTVEECDKETEDEAGTDVTMQPTTPKSATVPASTTATYLQIVNSIQTEEEPLRGKKNIYLYLLFDRASYVRQAVARIINGFPDEVAQMNSDIWRHYEANRQDAEVFERKMQVRSCLFSIARVEAQSALHRLCRDLSISGFVRNFNVRLCQVIPARVPILKLIIGGDAGTSALEVDININNTSGVYNSHLLSHCTLFDERFPALALMIKHWGLNAGVVDAQNGRINSYALVLLLVHYLQCGVSPPVLPDFFSLAPTYFNETRPIAQLSNSDMALLEQMPGRRANTQSLAELFIGFFVYYTSAVDFEHDWISIRRAKLLKRTELLHEPDSHRYAMYVEEPYDRKNAARCVSSGQNSQMPHIVQAFVDACEALTRRPDVRNIGVSMPR